MGYWKEYEIERDAMIARGYIPPERGKKYLCGCHFSDGYIRDYIVTNGSQGVCSYCGKKDVVLDLADFVNSLTPSLPSREWGTSPQEGEIERGLLDRTVVCLSSGTGAVHLALLACGVGPGDEVCVQSFTFCASSHPITYCGAKPVFIGSEKDTWNMDPELLEQAILPQCEKSTIDFAVMEPIAA